MRDRRCGVEPAVGITTNPPRKTHKDKVDRSGAPITNRARCRLGRNSIMVDFNLINSLGQHR